MKLVAVALVAACTQLDPIAPPSPIQPAPVRVPAPITGAPITNADGRTFAVVEYGSVQQECTGLGGEHHTFHIDMAGAASKAGHGGGHGFRWWHKPVDTRWFIAELAWIPAAKQSAGLAPCIEGKFDARIARVLPTAGREDARRRLAEIAATGMPPQIHEVAKATGTETVALARVHSIEPDGYVLDAIDGAPPSKLSILAGVAVLEDDLVIVARTGAQVTRVMIPDDLASAKRWLAVIRRGGFPGPAFAIGSFGDTAAARWQLVGDLETKGDCTTIRSAVAVAGQYQYNNVIVHAPEVTGTGRVVALALKRFEGGPCAATHRALRVYRVPTGHATHAIPNGAVSLID